MTLARRVAAFLLAAIGWVWLTLKLVADSVGRSTVVEDAQLLPGKMGAVLDWLAGQPGLVFYGLGVALLFIGAFLLWPWEVWADRILGRDGRTASLRALGAECAEISEVLLNDWLEIRSTLPKHSDKAYSLQLSLIEAGFKVPRKVITTDTNHEDG